MILDESGYRLNVGIVLANEQRHLFWGRRIGHDTWQFPQGGLATNETPQQAMYRELQEEVGLEPDDIEILGETDNWLEYQLPEQYRRRDNRQVVKGQKQKWFLLKLLAPEQKIKLDATLSPEFDSWRWVEFRYPVQEVIYFKRDVYREALNQFEPLLFGRAAHDDSR